MPGAVLFVFVAALGAEAAGSPFALALVAAGVRRRGAPAGARSPSRRERSSGRARHPLSTLSLPRSPPAGWSCWRPGSSGRACPAPTPSRSSTRATSGGGVTEVVSPLVDIRSRLVNRSATELFVVSATVPAYWRVTALPEFDGTYVGASPTAPSKTSMATCQAARPGSTENQQQYVITGLDGPARAGRRRAGRRVRRAALRWNAETSTLVRGRRASWPAATASRSCRPCPSTPPDELRAATSQQPPDPIYLELPDDFPASVGEHGREVTARRADPVRRGARAAGLVPLGVRRTASTCPRATATRPSRRSCASASATASSSPARSPPWPARSACRLGSPSASRRADAGRRRRSPCSGKQRPRLARGVVRRVGWVPFEPTPGRGAPGAESLHRRRRRQQDETVPAPGDGRRRRRCRRRRRPRRPAADESAADPVPDRRRRRRPPRRAHRSASGSAARDGRTPSSSLAVLVSPGSLPPELVRRWRRRHPDPDVAAQIATCGNARSVPSRPPGSASTRR